MREPLPLATIHEAVLEFLRGRHDAVVFGATAVNAYVSEPRMTQDIVLMSPRAAELAEEMRAHLSEYDLAMLFLAFPELKTEAGSVSETLQSLGANEEVMSAWRELVAQEIRLPDEEDEV